MTARWSRVVLGLMLLTLFGSQPGFAQTSEEIRALRKEVEALKEGQTAIQKELQELKNLLRARSAPASAGPQNVVLSVDGAPFMGDRNAKVTLVDFSDYHCPFCARHFRDTLPQIVTEYIDTGKVKYVFRDFPIEGLHPKAFKVHEAAYCAGDQGKYWEMHGRLFKNPNLKAGPKDLSDHAQALGLDVPAFEQCAESGKYATKVRKNMADGQNAGVNGTPTFFLGPTEPNGSTVKAERMIRGAQPYPLFKDAVDSLLSSQK